MGGHGTSSEKGGESYITRHALLPLPSSLSHPTLEGDISKMRRLHACQPFSPTPAYASSVDDDCIRHGA
jgi:hypothetical protein